MKYSVIIPIYNAEKTLRRCLDSLLPQLNSDIEVLLINDGSTDSSADICNEYLAVCESFKYFEQKNAGASAARNKGIDNAIGDYLLFVDSDDYVDKDYFVAIDSCFHKNRSVLLVFGLSFVSRTRSNLMTYEEKFFSGIEAVRQISLLSKKQDLYTLCNKAFVRSIILENNLRFNTSISIGEDSAFVFQYILHIDKFSTCSKTLYYVDESVDDSLSRKERKDLCDDLIISYKEIENHLINSSLDKTFQDSYLKILSRAYYRSAYSCFLEISRWNCSNAETKAEILKVCSAYKKSRIKPVGRDAKILSVPVLWEMTLLIRLMLKIKQ